MNILNAICPEIWLKSTTKYQWFNIYTFSILMHILFCFQPCICYHFSHISIWHFSMWVYKMCTFCSITIILASTNISLKVDNLIFQTALFEKWFFITVFYIKLRIHFLCSNVFKVDNLIFQTTPSFSIWWNTYSIYQNSV